jgi:hypothetical protein
MLCKPIYWGNEGPWLTIDDFSPWSAAKWLERAGVKIVDGCFCLRVKDYGYIPLVSWKNIPANLEKMQTILAIGKCAFDQGWTAEQRQPWLEAWE